MAVTCEVRDVRWSARGKEWYPLVMVVETRREEARMALRASIAVCTMDLDERAREAPESERWQWLGLTVICAGAAGETPDGALG